MASSPKSSLYEQSVLIPTEVCKSEEAGLLGIVTSPEKFPVRTQVLDFLSMQDFRYIRSIVQQFSVFQTPKPFTIPTIEIQSLADPRKIDKFITSAVT